MTTATIPQIETIDPAGLRELQVARPDARILDVRTGGEFASVHIPGAFNVPLDTLDEHATDLADLEHPVVLVCRSGGRARTAHGTLARAGSRHLYLLEGGMDAWMGAGGDVVRGESQTWALDRQVRLVAGSIALAGILASVFVPKAKWLAGGVAAGLVFSAATDTCAMGSALAKLPYNRTDRCDIESAVEGLRQAA